MYIFSLENIIISTDLSVSVDSKLEMRFYSVPTMAYYGLLQYRKVFIEI